MKTQTFALYFGNRGFFPETLIAGARKEMCAAVKKAGYNFIILDEAATKYGAVETPAEGAIYAKFLYENKGKFDGVILCLPNFGDENGAIAALRDCGVPILVQAYPDELDKMDNAHRRDAFCGKMSIMDVFHQYGLKFTNLIPHTAHPNSAAFRANLETFAAVCRVVSRLRRMNMGAIGARTTAFKTVRFDEIALQRHGINTETIDLSDVLARVAALPNGDKAVKDELAKLKQASQCNCVPELSMTNMAKLGVVLDRIVEEYDLGAVAIRCWIELEKTLRCAPCLLMGMLNERGVPATCEMDVCSSLMMTALSAAADAPAVCMDWNNNYGDDSDKCILFHCGPAAPSMMARKGKVVEHYMFAKTFGCGFGWGPNSGRFKPGKMTYATCKTEDGQIVSVLGEGEVTRDKIPDNYFGCPCVIKVKDLQQKLQGLGRGGFKHHMGFAYGLQEAALREALGNYLGYAILDV